MEVGLSHLNGGIISAQQHLSMHFLLKNMEKVLDACSSDRVAAFGTQVYQQLTFESRFNCTIAYAGKRQKASGAHVTECHSSMKFSVNAMLSRLRQKICLKHV